MASKSGIAILSKFIEGLLSGGWTQILPLAQPHLYLALPLHSSDPFVSVSE